MLVHAAAVHLREECTRRADHVLDHLEYIPVVMTRSVHRLKCRCSPRKKCWNIQIVRLSPGNMICRLCRSYRPKDMSSLQDRSYRSLIGI